MYYIYSFLQNPSALTADHRFPIETLMGLIGWGTITTRGAGSPAPCELLTPTLTQLTRSECSPLAARATFYYGNYDGKNSPPTFALQFDGNKWWDEVETSTTEYYYKEVIYVMKRDSITVCVAQTKAGQFPFITALQVRRLESSMYRYIDNSYPLIGWRRVAFGLNTYVR